MPRTVRRGDDSDGRAFPQVDRYRNERHGSRYRVCNVGCPIIDQRKFSAMYPFIVK